MNSNDLASPDSNGSDSTRGAAGSAGYDGAVTPGGAAAVRLLPGLMIHKASVGPMDNNAYLLTCTNTGARALIDAAADAPRLIELLTTESGSEAQNLEIIITTHKHADHHGALRELVDYSGARTAAGSEDAPELPIVPNISLVDGDVVSFGDASLDVIGLRGHTPGSVALVYEVPYDYVAKPEDDEWSEPRTAHIFTGDSLFPGGVGKTGSPQDFQQLFADVSERLFGRYADAWIYPGHGSDTTLATERPALDDWHQRGW